MTASLPIRGLADLQNGLTSLPLRSIQASLYDCSGVARIIQKPLSERVSGLEMAAAYGGSERRTACDVVIPSHPIPSQRRAHGHQSFGRSAQVGSIQGCSKQTPSCRGCCNEEEWPGTVWSTINMTPRLSSAARSGVPGRDINYYVCLHARYLFYFSISCFSGHGRAGQ